MGNRRQSLGQVQSNPIKIEILSDDEDETKTTKRAGAPAPTVSSAGITNAAPATELSSVQLFGTEISYKRSDKKTLFNTRDGLILSLFIGQYTTSRYLCCC